MNILCSETRYHGECFRNSNMILKKLICEIDLEVGFFKLFYEGDIETLFIFSQVDFRLFLRLEKNGFCHEGECRRSDGGDEDRRADDHDDARGGWHVDTLLGYEGFFGNERCLELCLHFTCNYTRRTRKKEMRIVCISEALLPLDGE